MSTWTWKQAVAEQALDIVNSKKSVYFELNDLYERLALFEERFPRNRRVRCLGSA